MLLLNSIPLSVVAQTTKEVCAYVIGKTGDGHVMEIRKSNTRQQSMRKRYPERMTKSWRTCVSLCMLIMISSKCLQLLRCKDGQRRHVQELKIHVVFCIYCFVNVFFLPDKLSFTVILISSCNCFIFI